MRKIFDFLFSMKMALVLLLLFAASIGAATFIEEKYDTETARMLVYNAKWFEVILVLLALNFIANIKRYRLLKKEKLPVLLFHLAFILLITGAGVTRYISFDGTMHIREGQASDVMYSSDPCFQVKAIGPGLDYSSGKPLYLGEGRVNALRLCIDTKDNGEIVITGKKYMKNAVTQVDENVPEGVDIVQLVVAGENGRETVLLRDGGAALIGDKSITYNNNKIPGSIRLVEQEGKLFLKSPSGIVETFMHGQGADSNAVAPRRDTVLEFTEGRLYTTEKTPILFVRLFKKAGQKLVPGGPEDKGDEVLITGVSYRGKEQEVPVYARRDSKPEFSEIRLGGITLRMAYGSREIRLPFSLHLEDFALERYAGSMSPSSYASQVILADPSRQVRRPYRIYMNHVLDYRGYRFFQSSYDPDEKGTILSVNHDFFGTWISYLGYILLGLGFILTLFSRNSRFSALNGHIRKIREARRAGVAVLIAGLTLFSGTAFPQQGVSRSASAAEAEKFGHLLVQTYDGRFEPVHTLAYDVIHKVSRKDKINAGAKGELDDMQVFLDMMLDPGYWRQQKIVWVREKSVRDIIGVTSPYACFDDFIDQRGMYKLRPYAEDAFRKSPATQNAFDKEIIRVDERLNILLTLLNGSLLKVFPIQDSPTHAWISFTDSLATVPFTGALESLTLAPGSGEPNYNNLMRYYLTAVYQGAQTGNYTLADKVLGSIGLIQREITPPSLLPSETRVNVEIFYNKANIFSSLKNWYGLLSLVLLVLAFTDNLRPRKSRVVSYALNLFIGLLALAFLYHTFGMGLRWYLTGHAPWSNGYEALLLVAWGGLLAGFSFMRYSKITLAATALLAFSILMTAGHSSYDPQLTNLQPVLKSYWLIIHVAVITVSYGFLALGFILGLINLVLYLFKSGKNALSLNLVIRELTLTNEMALSVGIVLATLGTFLGGVWANESWGRYWGWDAKETWALVIVITYAIILHLRMIPKMNSPLTFNAASVLGFGSVIMTFVGVNYYLSKGLHSYAADEKAVFPLWAWMIIGSVFLLIAVAALKEAGKPKSM